MQQLEIYQAIILGIVEGVTEYLPVSSTGHLILTSALLDLDSPPDRKAAVDVFSIVIQGGAILAVLGLYRKRVWQMIQGLFGRDVAGRRLLINLFIAFLPAAVFGLMLDDWIMRTLFYPVPVIGALAFWGLVMIFLTPWQRRFFHEADGDGAADAHTYVDIEHLTWRRALIIGFLQCIAMWPGTSRSLMTIAGGMMVGLRPKHAAEFSFLLGLPTLGGACVYKLYQSLSGDGPNILGELGVVQIAIGIAVATISAALAIKWLVGYLSKHGVAIFGWYRLALSAVMIVLVWRGVLSIGPEDASAPEATVVSETPPTPDP